MLKLINIKKDYLLSGQKPVNALKGITLSFRRNEFVSILGPSGCGKTTLLNIIGGLDRYTSGDLLIEGRTTKKYKDKQWDTYRNHSIGFVFQSYNLVSHLNILGNVELALTIGGIKRKERRQRAMDALDKVGLKGLYKKKPNQLSGGQMQRVAIARALVNDPEIVLADEPTGALDTETSVQIMELLKEVAKDRLVIMVTHNPDLAKQYSSRIVNLLDGLVVNDTNPYKGETKQELALTQESKELKNKHNSKMKLHTAFLLSGKNLISKFKRTSLVIAAGSIGIIGVSSVLAVSTGVKGYISKMQDDMLSGNPISIEKTSLDITGLMNAFSQNIKADALKDSIKDGKIYVDQMVEFLAKQKDNLESLTINNSVDEKYLAFVNDMPKEYYSAMMNDYGIDHKINIFTDVTMFGENQISVERRVSLKALETIYTHYISHHTEFSEYADVIKLFTTTFYSMPDGNDYILEQYDFVSDKETSYLPKGNNEVLLVLDKDQRATDIFLGQLGFYSEQEFNTLVNKFANPQGAYKDDADIRKEFDAEEIMNHKFYYVPNNSDYLYKEGPFGMLSYSSEATKSNPLPSEAKEIKITGIVRPKKNVSYGCLKQGFVVSPAFEKQMIEDTKDSLILNTLNSKFEAYKTMTDEQKSSFMFAATSTDQYYYLDKDKVFGSDYSSCSPVGILNIGGGSMTGGMIAQLLGRAYSIESQFENAVRTIGGNSIPNSISIYPNSFNEKYKVTDYLDKWNGDENIILSNGQIIENRENVTYNDTLELIISLINTMIDIITIALVCFTSLSLVVSTVMIGIITYVSVVERVKEIGIIRSLGGRKIDVSNLFNVETFIIGLCSGIFGLIITSFISALINLIINSFATIGSIVYLPWYFVIIILAVSILLTLLSGLIPARAAAHKDPVVALRTE